MSKPLPNPTPEQLETAIEWLLVNEGDGGESVDCWVVAEWLKKQQKQALAKEAIREAKKEVAKALGVSVAKMKRINSGEEIPPPDWAQKLEQYRQKLST